MAAAEQIFSAGGKRLRPAMVFLVSKATAQLAGLEYVWTFELFFQLSIHYCALLCALNLLHLITGKLNFR